MKSLTAFINEAIGNYQVTYISNGRQSQSLCRSIDACRKLISGVKNLTYYDITGGDNASEVSNLVEWAGVGGFWANKAENKPSNGREKREIEKVLALKKALGS